MSVTGFVIMMGICLVLGFILGFLTQYNQAYDEGFQDGLSWREVIEEELRDKN